MGRTPSGANKRFSRKGRQQRMNNLQFARRIKARNREQRLALANPTATPVPEANITGQFGGSWPGPSKKLEEGEEKAPLKMEQMKATNYQDNLWKGQSPVSRLPSLLVPSTQTRKSSSASASTVGKKELTASQLFFLSKRGPSAANICNKLKAPTPLSTSDNSRSKPNITPKDDVNPGMEVEEDETLMPVEHLTNQRITCQIIRTNVGVNITRPSHLKPTECFVCMNPHRSKPHHSKVTRTDYLFLFTEILKIPRKASLKYLENFEQPEEWMGLCQQCRGLLLKVKRLRAEISELEAKLQNYQKDVLTKMKDTLEDPSRSTFPYGSAKKVERETLFTIWEHVRNSAYDSMENSEKIFHENIVKDEIENDHDPLSSNSGDCDEEGSYEMTDAKNFIDEDDEIEVSSKEESLISHKKKDRHLPSSSQEPSTSQHERPPTSFLYDCPNCPEIRAYNVGRYAQHLIIHQRRPYRCTICLELFPDEDDMKNQHWSEKHANVQEHSGERFIKLHFNPGKIWKCMGCDLGFLTERKRDVHELNCLAKTSSSCNSSNSKDHQCKVCHKTFRHFEEWRLHRVLEHPEVERMSCFYCDESFAEKTIEGLEIRHDKKLVDHLSSVHKSGDSCEEFFGCELCGIVITNGKSLGKANHFLKKHGIPLEETYACRICSKPLRSWCTNFNHISFTHFRSGLGICEICGQEFKRPRSLADHKMNIHGIQPEERIKVFSCPKEGCDYKSVNKDTINPHYKRNHDDARPHKCPHCEMAFKNTGKLKTHLEIHLNKGSKPYQCEICGNSFAVKNYLYIHKRLSHEKRTFPSTNKKKPPKKGPKKKQNATAITDDNFQQEPDRMEAESSVAAEDAIT